MANQLNTNPISIDTVMTSSYKAATAAALGTLTTLLIEKIYWRNPGTIGDEALITDTSDTNEIAKLRCEVANQSQVLDWTARPRLVKDFYVAKLGSGILEIYIR